MRRLAVGLLMAGLVVVALVLAVTADAEAGTAKKRKRTPPPNSIAWSQVSGPSFGPAQSIGGYAAGCVTGAQPLAGEGTGYQVIRMSRQRNYGHPELIAYLKDFGRKVAAAGLGSALVGDMGQARGGPMSFGHASHQMGLDADVWLRLDLPPMGRNARESVTEVKYVDYDRKRVNAAWSDRQAQLIRIAAADPRVARIFINPAIKAAMCGHPWPNRDFLRKLRPWYGHDGHMHVRLHCPAGSPLCEDQKDAPDGDGCGEELTSWLGSVYPLVERHEGKPQPRYVDMPAACRAVLRAGGTRVAAVDGLAAGDASAGKAVR